MAEHEHAVGFLTSDGYVAVQNLLTTGSRSVFRHLPNITIADVSQVLYWNPNTGGYYCIPVSATRLPGVLHNCIVALGEGPFECVRFPSTATPSTPEFDTVEQAIAYCDIVS